MICLHCGAEWNLDAEDRHYYRAGGLIVSEQLVKCRGCISETISFSVESFHQVLPVPSFGLDAMFSPRMMDVIVRIHPIKNRPKE